MHTHSQQQQQGWRLGSRLNEAGDGVHACIFSSWLVACKAAGM
jgi:hypothetical protein